MQRAIRTTAAVTLSGFALAGAIAAFATPEPAKRPSAGPSLFETLMLMQYGHGAYGAHESESRGERR